MFFELVEDISCYEIYDFFIVRVKKSDPKISITASLFYEYAMSRKYMQI